MGDVRRRRSALIVKPNELATKGRSLLSGKQIDIVEYLLSCVKPTDSPEQIYDFSVKEFCEAFGLYDKSGKHYETLKNEIQKIADVSCWIVDGKKKHLFRWLNRVTIDEGSGTIQVSFHETVRQYIFNIEPHAGYHKYKLANIAALKGKTGRNKYPKLVYMFLKGYEEQGGVTISVEEFCKIIPNTYKEYKRINARILAESQRKIDELTDISFDYRAKKEKGSKVTTHIQFTIHKKRGKSLEELDDKQYIAIDGEPWLELPF